jgi:hypothetical protein
VNVLALLEKVERMPAKERRAAMPRIDGDLKRAVTEDMANFSGEVVSAVAFRGGRGGVHSVRTGQFFCAFGWAEASFPYRRGGGGRQDAFDAFGIRDKLTPYAADEVARLGVGLGSFEEAQRTMSTLHCGQLSESKIRDTALAAGEAALREQESPAKDIRAYTPAQKREPDGSKEVLRTLVSMADGTNAPSVKADTKGVKGKNGCEAGSRQIRVMSFCEYERTTEKGVPIPIKGSFSYAVTDGDAARMTGVIRVNGEARGYGTVPRMQCVADGEEAIEKAMRDAFQKDMVFTNDFMHASGYLSKCVNALGIADPDREYKTCRSIMLRIGAGSAVKRIRRLYADRLAKSKDATSALDYLDKRKDNMNYGWLRKNGYYISSCHIEAAARILVARRCKQAGMHWRHRNAARVAALIAKYRSAV